MSASIAWAHHVSAFLPGLILTAVVCLARWVRRALEVWR